MYTYNANGQKVPVQPSNASNSADEKSMAEKDMDVPIKMMQSSDRLKQVLIAIGLVVAISVIGYFAYKHLKKNDKNSKSKSKSGSKMSFGGSSCSARSASAPSASSVASSSSEDFTFRFF